ncbi:BAX inhibitor (BI)-1/YccA family protein [Pseudomonas sp. G11-1]|nr:MULTISPECIES: Bax inhibitor-1/YccA family protein [Halopseudomonas]MCO5787617.1 BAX inhibitor (BI)-1/YccA family protein [Pseudomonas sp. G11-1]MCO5790843.1 BAX inhibitor (BI)-1/YccA family protein [Pseudomonas sp. G11-2]EZQ20287.1 membrane protein [Halopseudomonas bauzanensis]TKA91698.1 Bax inhibitor-1/YccA family protein [Halopseudomonas bauzanensis]WGK63252.1 Bax inhibitor-1/YccA family protein [Halopseudomonas sp. SMJS2]
MQQRNTLQHTGVSEVEVSKLFRNTYSLLAMTLAFSALVAFTSMSLNLPHPGLIITLVGFYGLLFLTAKLRNSGWGLISTFVFTGFLGYTLGPILNAYLSLPNGGQLVTMALGMTALVFFGLSAYAILSRKDFSFLSGFIMAGFVVLLCAVVASFFIQISGLQLAISAGFVLFSSAVILYQTSAIIHGGEDNYIMATITLFVSIYNLFLSLLQLLGIFSND